MKWREPLSFQPVGTKHIPRSVTTQTAVNPDTHAAGTTFCCPRNGFLGDPARIPYQLLVETTVFDMVEISKAYLGAAAAKAGFVPRPGHRQYFCERPVLVEAAFQ